MCACPQQVGTCVSGTLAIWNCVTSSLCAYFWTQRGTGSEAGILCHVLQLSGRRRSDALLLLSWFPWPLGAGKAWDSAPLPAQQHEVVRPLGQARRTSWKAASPLSPPLLYSLSWASFSPGSSVAAVSPELPLVTRPLSVEESLGPLRAHRELSPVAKATKSPTWLQASPWTVGGGEAWRGLLEMETRSPFSRALGKDVSLASLLCILF